MSNYRVIVTADRCAIVRTRAAADGIEIQATLAQARTMMKLAFDAQVAVMRERLDRALRTRERDLPMEEATEPMRQSQVFYGCEKCGRTSAASPCEHCGYSEVIPLVTLTRMGYEPGTASAQRTQGAAGGRSELRTMAPAETRERVTGSSLPLGPDASAAPAAPIEGEAVPQTGATAPQAAAQPDPIPDNLRRVPRRGP